MTRVGVELQLCSFLTSTLHGGVWSASTSAALHVFHSMRGSGDSRMGPGHRIQKRIQRIYLLSKHFRIL